MKKIISTSLFLLLVISIFAQSKKPTISFEETSHDFGTITQEDGLATVVFNFTNTGAEPVIISEVKSSCGCTSPDYSKEPIAPGEKGFVSAAYNPVNRPGTFSKTLTVVSNAENGSIILKISGKVTEKVETIEDKYPNEIGVIRLDKVLTNFSNIYNDETKTETINIINTGEQDVTITTNESQIPAYINVKIEPETLSKDQEGTITITFDGTIVNDWDYIRSLFYLYLDGVINTSSRISVSAIVKERFDDTDLENAPKIEFDDVEFNFGTLTQGEKVDHVYTFKNTGKSDLIIRKTRASCGCTAINTTEGVIPPGASGTIKTTFNSSGKSGNQNKIITVITNDPTQDKILLKIKGIVNTGDQN